MPTFNPYEAPQSAFASVSDSASEDDRNGPWRDGKDLVVRHDTRLPERCIKCNAQAKTPLKRKRYFWHSSGYYLLVPINLILYAIVAAFVRKQTHLSAGLCPQHSKRRTLSILGAVGTFVLAVCVFVFAAAQGGYGPPIYLFAVLLLVASIVISMVGGGLVTPRRIGERYARFTGCGPEFLQTLPQFRGSDH
jgi:hypothetical protein